MAILYQSLITTELTHLDNKFPLLNSNSNSNSNFTHFKPKTQFKLCCSNNEHPQQILKGFSALESDPPWESSDVWSTLGLYFFNLHVPLSFGGLSLVANLLDQPVLDPQLRAVAILVIGTSELFADMILLQFTAKPGCQPVNFVQCRTSVKERNWVFAALIGFAILVAVIYLTLYLLTYWLEMRR